MSYIDLTTCIGCEVVLDPSVALNFFVDLVNFRGIFEKLDLSYIFADDGDYADMNVVEDHYNLGSSMVWAESKNEGGFGGGGGGGGGRGRVRGGVAVGSERGEAEPKNDGGAGGRGGSGCVLKIGSVAERGPSRKDIPSHFLLDTATLHF